VEPIIVFLNSVFRELLELEHEKPASFKQLSQDSGRVVVVVKDRHELERVYFDKAKRVFVVKFMEWNPH